MHIIVPCAGRSSRFPDMPPKWMLPDHEGLPMVRRAVAGLGARADQFIFTILREHEEKFQARKGLCVAFGQDVNCVILDEPTRSQSETVAETLRRTGIDGPFMVKDSDNYFAVDRLVQNHNYVCVASLSSFSQVNPQNKSYVQVDQEDAIVNFREKQVISDMFSVGGYFFTSPRAFLGAYEELTGQSRLSMGELYLSEIIAWLSMNGHVFRVMRISQYQDWGTVHEWRDYLKTHRQYFIAVDGFLFEQGSKFFHPRFEEVKANPIAVETVSELKRRGQSLVYISIRPPELEALTRHQIAEQGLPDQPTLFGCDLTQWVLLTAPHANQPFTTGLAVEMSPDDPLMIDKLDLQG
ncbi:hypothetical protein [Neorhizobium galegae]|uniref:hypothetical protein n=1 Tax=Neorhizobium galegae TaxID=399 RepID=UPI0012844E43|nr:hypothetical protein [Neorhizobium galegae]KAA9387954.1 hypothetical protein F4V88_16590 [Neorhizobium galegae]MCM2496696.1 hypothetical protein [Neorhizobium galegae]